MDQVELLKQTVIQKNKEIEELKNLLRSGGGEVKVEAKSSKEKALWFMLFKVCDVFVKCQECGGRTKPVMGKNNYVLAVCKKCGKFNDIKQKKMGSLNAYYEDMRRFTGA